LAVHCLISGSCIMVISRRGFKKPWAVIHWVITLKLNGRPRKTIGLKTLAECFEESVAMTG